MLPPPELTKAFEAVRAVCPEVVQVFYGIDGRWQFMDEDFNAPSFHDRVDVGILEDANDAVDSLCGFPAAFAYQGA